MAFPRLAAVPLSALKTQTSSSAHDSLLVVFHQLKAALASATGQLDAAALGDVARHAEVDSLKEVTLVRSDAAPGRRIILSPISSLHGDCDDVARFAPAARAAIRKASSAGSLRPLLYLPELASLTSHDEYARCLEVSVLAALQELHVPLQVRERAGVAKAPQVTLGVVGASQEVIAKLEAVEAGVRLARDITGGDPERMTPLRCAEYIKGEFKSLSNVQVSVITDLPTIAKEYPLLYAVARCSLAVPRHHPCVVRLDYRAPDQAKVKDNLFFVGKGVTFDTGGADIKAGGHMRAMSRDKGGAASCAGLLRTVAALAPLHANVTAVLGFARNSVGADSYVDDEVITARSGRRVLVGNTDAEGRMVMTDLLRSCLEASLHLPDPSTARLFTVATLTGHVIRAYGSYPAAVENGPARAKGVARRMQEGGERWGEPWEVSRLRRDDFEFISPTQPTEDVVQANDLPSSATSRGHQFPAAFMIVASGLDEHGRDAKVPIAYTHLDVAGVVEEGAKGLSLGKTTGAPVTSFAAFVGLLD